MLGQRVTNKAAPADHKGSALYREAFARLLAAMLIAGPAGGCSMSLGSMGSLVADEKPTHAVAPKAVSPLSPELGSEDWRRARGALAVALDPQGNGSAVAWDNPDTTLKGSFTPVGPPFVTNDEICRAFLATIVGQGSTTSLQGTACRPSGGEWSITDVRPWKKPA